jgi:hypothetical protein
MRTRLAKFWFWSRFISSLGKLYLTRFRGAEVAQSYSRVTNYMTKLNQGKTLDQSRAFPWMLNKELLRSGARGTNAIKSQQ